MQCNPLADFFDDPATWEVVASGQAEGHLTRAEGPAGKTALRLDFDFHGSGGFIVARKVVHFILAETFELRLGLRGHSLANHFEFKVADPSGTNVWRYQRQNYQVSPSWTDCRITERDLPFAWGPAGGGAPKAVGAIELVIAAGPGGKGEVYFCDIALEDQTLGKPKEIHASSHLANHPADAVFARNSLHGWQANEGDAAPQWWVDFGQTQRFGGLVIQWPIALPPRSYTIEISDNGQTWTQIHRATRASGTRSHVPAPRAEARFLRISFARAESAAIAALQLESDAFSRTPNEFIHAVAADFPRGWFPRYWLREQSYWTPVGSPQGRRRALINEEGMVEVDEAGFSLEPFLVCSGKLITWADATIERSLTPDDVPFPCVSWQVDDTQLTIQPWVDGEDDSLILRVTYRLENHSGHDMSLAVAARPFQVNPPWQAFRNLGGRSPIHQIRCNASGLVVDGRSVLPNLPPLGQGAALFEEGGVLEFLARGETPPFTAVDDESGLASAVMVWSVPNGGQFEVTVSVPFFDQVSQPTEDGRNQAIAHWRQFLAPVEWQVPASAHSAVECFRSAASHILINRDGPAIQPGPRRYTRSWVRDCVIMGAAMTKAGLPHVLREFIEWYVQFQREDGFVPCVVDRDGVDWLVENDSHGQWIWGIRESFRYDGDIDFLSSLWTSVSKAAEHLRSLRATRMTQEYVSGEHATCYGLLPESASHEGYLAHPVHSYWDDFWGIRGLEAAADIAEQIGNTEEANRWRKEARSFLHDVLHSIDQVIAQRQLNYIPGSVEWADFDPTATANAIAQLDFADSLPAQPMHQMLETYLDGFRRKHRGEIPWLNYTAYEIRIIGALVRVGKREEAHELLEFFLSDRRPLEWNQWPEITWHDPRAPGHLGDVPHTWIAAEYMLALASMIASEREDSGEMIVASGLPWSWISQENGFSVRGLMTRYGSLDFQMSVNPAGNITFHLGELGEKPHRLIVAAPLPPGRRIISACDAIGQPLEIDASGTSVTVNTLPVTAILSLS